MRRPGERPEVRINQLGYGARFGLVHVDFDTQQRALKRSARWYREFIARARSDEAH